MPSLPKPQKPAYRAPKPKKKASSDYKFYNSQRWRNYSKRYRTTCEVCLSLNHQRDITPSAIGTRGVVDHIVPMQEGGSPWDANNHMGMCGEHHNIKRGLESHGYVVASMQGREGLIPKDRNEIIERLTRGQRAPGEGHEWQGGGGLLP